MNVDFMHKDLLSSRTLFKDTQFSSICFKFIFNSLESKPRLGEVLNFTVNSLCISAIWLYFEKRLASDF